MRKGGIAKKIATIRTIKVEDRFAGQFSGRIPYSILVNLAGANGTTIASFELSASTWIIGILA